MSEFAIVTDSSADFPADMVKDLGVLVLPLRFTVQGKTYQNFLDSREMDPKRFYQLLREGETATTSAVNAADYTLLLEPLLQEGLDVLILTSSSGVSANCQSAGIAAQELHERHPERRIYVVDTLCASLGQGLFIWHTVQLQRMGRDIDHVHKWVEQNKRNVCHWFTVDDLYFLKRGGQVSAKTAFDSSMLQIRPILHLDNEGRLIHVGKVRGRQASLKALVDHMEQSAVHPEEQTVFIGQSDCEGDAETVASEVRRRFHSPNVCVGHIGPVIGAQAGPGTIALFFMGRER